MKNSNALLRRTGRESGKIRWQNGFSLILFVKICGAEGDSAHGTLHNTFQTVQAEREGRGVNCSLDLIWKIVTFVPVFTFRMKLWYTMSTVRAVKSAELISPGERKKFCEALVS